MEADNSLPVVVDMEDASPTSPPTTNNKSEDNAMDLDLAPGPDLKEKDIANRVSVAPSRTSIEVTGEHIDQRYCLISTRDVKGTLSLSLT